MGMKHVQCLVFLLSLVFCSGICVKQPEDGSRKEFSRPQPLLGNPSVHASEKKHKNNKEEQQIISSSHILVSTETKLQPSSAMPQLDVVTPITTVPVINPTNPTMTNPNNPAYDPVPTPTNPRNPMMTPVTNPYSQPTMGTPASSGQSWCIASQTASQTALQVALDYACGYGGADCSAIQSSGSCYNPNTVRDHASYAFNDYYQKNPVATSCDFGGTAVITNIDPSTPTCHYPSTSTSSSVLNTTNPMGSTVFGSVPPGITGTASSMPMTLPLFFTLICFLKSLISLVVYK